MTLEVSVDALQLLRDGWTLQLWQAHEESGYCAHFSRKHYARADSQRARVQAVTRIAPEPGGAIDAAARKTLEFYYS